MVAVRIPANNDAPSQAIARGRFSFDLGVTPACANAKIGALSTLFSSFASPFARLSHFRDHRFMPFTLSTAFKAALLSAPLAFFAALPGQAAELISASSVAGFATGPLKGDAFAYRAVLVDVEDGADLYLYTEDTEGSHLEAHASDIVWRGAMFGQRPRLEVSASGSLKLISGNESIGRGRWRKTLTIAYRDNRFLVAGYTLDTWDTLDPKLTGNCDVNLLTGNAVIDGTKTTIKSLSATPVEEWNMDLQPDECPE